MKRKHVFLAILLVLALVLSMVAGCGETATPTPTKAVAPTAAAAATPTKAAEATKPPAATTPAAAATPSASSQPFTGPGVKTGVTDKSILIGGTYPLSGPLAGFATIAKGVETYLKYYNTEKGGVYGRQITFKYLDDGYQPANTIKQTRQLVEDEKVFIMFNGFGTAPQLAVREYLNENKVPQLFVNSGQSNWSTEYQKYPWSMGWQPNYQDEAAIYGKYILETKPNAKIGILYQNDDYGKDYIIGLEKALGDKAKTMIVAKQPFEVTAADVNSQLANLKAAGADTLVWAASSKFVAQGLKEIYNLGWKPLNIVNVPAAQKNIMEQAGLDAAEGVISAAYIKDPTDKTFDSDSGMVFFRDMMKKYFPGGAKDDDLISLANFQGFTLGWNLVKVLEQAGKDLTREALMNAAVNMNYTDSPFTLPGIIIKTTPTQRAPISQLQLMKFEKGDFKRFGPVYGAHN